MSIISTVAPEQADGKVAEVYGQIQQMMGRVPNAFQLYSSSPVLLEQQMQQIAYYMQHPTLSFPLLAMVRMLVSQHNDCQYCVGFNEGMLMHRVGLTPEQVAATRRNPADAPLPDKDKAMLLLVLKATKTPKMVEKSDMDQLRALGWSDGDIMDAVYHGARNVAVDIVFNAFKIENDF
ncbi:MAG: carboxymuconolactone decarboxylase family protein [Sulfuricella sp.]